MKFFVSVFLCFFVVHTSQAGNQCSQASAKDKATKSIDRRNEIGPIRDQDSLGWCYAFTASDLLTHYLSHNGKKFLPQGMGGDLKKRENMVSPVGMAHLFNEEVSPNYYNAIKDMNSSELAAYNKKKEQEMKAKGKTWSNLSVVAESGNVQRCMEESIDKGFCLEKDAPSESFSHVLAKICSQRKLCATSLMGVLKLIYDKAGKDSLRSSNPLQCDLYAVAKAAYPSIPANELKDIVSQTTRDKVFYDLAEAACQRELRYSLMDTVTFTKPSIKNVKGSLGNNENIFSALDQKLEEGQIVGVNYYSSFLLHPGVKPDGGHASSIVGKRFNPENCQVEYILRNSWGPSCGHYIKENSQFSPCMSSKEMNDPGFFSRYSNELNKKIAEKNKEIASLEASLKSQKPGTAAFKQITSKINIAKEVKRILSEQSSFYGKSSQGLYPLKSKFCGDKFKPEPRNPAVVCDKASNYLYIQKGELKKYMYGVSFFE